MIMQLTVGHVAVLVEARRIKLQATFDAREAVRMPMAVQCRYEILHNRFIASLAFRRYISHIAIPLQDAERRRRK